MKSLLKIYFFKKIGFALVLIFVFSCGNREKNADNNLIDVTTFLTLIKDQVAAGLLKAEKLEEALNLYLSTLESDPFEPTTHSNIAVILSRTEKPDEALKSFQHALKLAEDKKDLKDIFVIRYNLGVYYGDQKKIAEALENYQAALDIVPTSKEIKTNIELLIQSQQQNQNGEGENKDKKSGEDSKDQKNNKDGKDDQNKKDDKDNKDPKEDNKKSQNSPKYKPRPFKGDQLSEGDVKKILGELKNQEQKIRANFDKKERKDSKNEKDW